MAPIPKPTGGISRKKKIVESSDEEEDEGAIDDLMDGKGKSHGNGNGNGNDMKKNGGRDSDVHMKDVSLGNFRIAVAD